MKIIMKLAVVGMLVVGICLVGSTTLDAKGHGKGSGKSVQNGGQQQHKNKEQNKQSSSAVSSQSSQSATTASTPYGWTRGRKTGWKGGSYPPGWSKWDKNKQEQWSSERVHAVQDIDVLLVEYKFPETQSSQIINSFDQAIAGGLAINDARKKITDGLKDGDTRRNLMIDAAQTSLNLLR